MFFNANVITHFNVQSSPGDVIDLTQSSSNEEIIDLTQSSSDDSTTHFSSSFDDELGTSPDDDDRNQTGFVFPDSNISNDDDYIPPRVVFNRVAQPPAIKPSDRLENLDIRFNAICRKSTYFHISASFINLYTKKLKELNRDGGGSYKSTSFLACMKRIDYVQRCLQYTDTFDPDFLKLTNPNRNEYLNHLKKKAKLSGSVHQNLSVKVCTWFASVEASKINLKPSSFACTRGNRKNNFITSCAFREWLDAQTDLV